MTGTISKLYVLVRFADDSHLERNPVPENQEVVVLGMMKADMEHIIVYFFIGACLIS